MRLPFCEQDNYVTITNPSSNVFTYKGSLQKVAQTIASKHLQGAMANPWGTTPEKDAVELPPPTPPLRRVGQLASPRGQQVAP